MHITGTFCHGNFFAHANIFFGLVKPYRIHCVFKSHAIGKTHLCLRLIVSNKPLDHKRYQGYLVEDFMVYYVLYSSTRQIAGHRRAQSPAFPPLPMLFYLDIIEETYNKGPHLAIHQKKAPSDQCAVQGYDEDAADNATRQNHQSLG
jgi:hypothetical protein